MSERKLTDDEIYKIYKEHLKGFSLEQLAIKYSVTRTLLRRRMVRLELPIKRFNSVSSAVRDAFEVLDAEKAYLIGLLAADGSIVNNYICLELHKKDVELLELFRKILCPKNKFTCSRNCYRIAVYSTHLVEQLNNIGIFPNKSHNPFTVRLDKKFFPDFIRGCIDGDGHTSSNVVKLYNTSYPLLVQIRSYFVDNGIILSSVYKSSEKQMLVWTIQIKHKESLDKLCDLIWYPGCFCLKRKDLRQYRANFKDKRFKVV